MRVSYNSNIVLTQGAQKVCAYLAAKVVLVLLQRLLCRFKDLNLCSRRLQCQLDSTHLTSRSGSLADSGLRRSFVAGNLLLQLRFGGLQCANFRLESGNLPGRGRSVQRLGLP